MWMAPIRDVTWCTLYKELSCWTISPPGNHCHCVTSNSDSGHNDSETYLWKHEKGLPKPLVVSAKKVCPVLHWIRSHSTQSCLATPLCTPSSPQNLSWSFVTLIPVQLGQYLLPYTSRVNCESGELRVSYDVSPVNLLVIFSETFVPKGQAWTSTVSNEVIRWLRSVWEMVEHLLNCFIFRNFRSPKNTWDMNFRNGCNIHQRSS